MPSTGDKNRPAARFLAASFLIIALSVFSVRTLAKSSSGLWDFRIYAAAARAWAEGRNPYDEASLRAHSTIDLGNQRSIAPPITLIVIAPFAMLPTTLASWVWTVFTLVLLGVALVMLVRWLRWPLLGPRAMMFYACVLLLGPLQSGIVVGQPTIPAVACIILTIAFAERGQHLRAGLFLALATALKLQLGLPLIAYLFVRRKWRAAAIASLAFAIIAALAVGRMQLAGQSWFDDWTRNMRDSATAGGRNDFLLENSTRDHLLNLQLPMYALTGSRAAANALAFFICAVLVGCYLPVLWRERKLSNNPLLHYAFILVLLLLPVYHRYYDATLLIAALAWGIASHKTFLLLLAPFVLPVGWAMNLIKRGYLPDSVLNRLWWNAGTLSLQSWLLLAITIVLLCALYRRRLPDTFPHMKRLACVLALIICGCSIAHAPSPRSASEAAMFAPVAMRIHPIFTQVQDWTGDNRPDGIEALLEFTDQFGDPTKAAGTVIFELYRYRPYNPDPRGDRVVNPWNGSLKTLSDQQTRWNRTSRTYSFQLDYPHVNSGESYVLSATFDTGSTRFFDRVILEGQSKEPHSVLPPAFPTTGPIIQPAPSP